MTTMNIIKNTRRLVEMGGDGIHRKEIPEIPVDAMREAVTSSFAHARYDLRVQHENADADFKVEFSGTDRNKSPLSGQDSGRINDQKTAI